MLRGYKLEMPIDMKFRIHIGDSHIDIESFYKIVIAPVPN